MSVLSGLTVVEFAEGIAGPLAGLRLGELGAAVIKLESERGDWLRNVEPRAFEGEFSAAFYELNRGKRSVVLTAANARELMRGLLLKADVFITDRRARELEALGVDASADVLAPENPRLISVFVSAWGRHGPLGHRKGSELTAQAMAGYTRYLGSFGKPAVRIGADMASAGTGTFAIQAVLAALYSRQRTGRGQRVDLSLVNSLVAMKSVHLAAQSDPDGYDGPRVGGANHDPDRGWKTADDPILFKFGGAEGSEGRHGWVGFVKEIGLEHLLDDPRCDKEGRLTTGRGLHARTMKPVYEEAFRRYSAKALCEIIARHGGDSSIYVGAREALEHEQTRALGLIRSGVDESGAVRRVRAFPGQFSHLKTQTSLTAPALGQHTGEVLAELGKRHGAAKEIL